MTRLLPLVALACCIGLLAPLHPNRHPCRHGASSVAGYLKGTGTARHFVTIRNATSGCTHG